MQDLEENRNRENGKGIRGGNMVMEQNRKLILENGQEYCGYGFGAETERICELVFNTSMVGYQEILSDLSYADQTVVMTYPLIGNYGMAEEDYESKVPAIGALAVRDYRDVPSNFRSTATLSEVMKRYQIPGISGIDTRKLTRVIRDEGSCQALITGISTSKEQGLALLKGYSRPHDAVSRVSCKEKYVLPGTEEKYHVAAIDCGMKQRILAGLTQRGCRVTVVPYDTPPEEIAALGPDGIFLSNGPGDPEDVPETIQTVKALRGRYPIFGICLGFQMIALAYGAKTYKLKFGHHGGNHPVRDLATGKIEITSQNHSYAVKADSLAATPLRATHVNLLDQTLEGVCCEEDRVFGVQYHPESAPGPQDSGYLFDRFMKLMEEGKNNG